ncbi:hypothetical protein XENOCAPTIV_024365, partial [Xenoophorus captivus]
MENSIDVALYSGLAAGIVAVVILIVAAMLYRKNHSDYGVDVIDSSALTGGFQSFNFKTTRQGEASSYLYFSPTSLQMAHSAVSQPIFYIRLQQPKPLMDKWVGGMGQ